MNELDNDIDIFANEKNIKKKKKREFSKIKTQRTYTYSVHETI